jgi:hypothetical protein
MGRTEDTDPEAPCEEGDIGDEDDRVRGMMMFPYWCVPYTVPYPVCASSIFRCQVTECAALIDVLVPDDRFDPVSVGTVLKLPAACNATVPPSVILYAFFLGVIGTAMGTVFLPIFSTS